MGGSKGGINNNTLAALAIVLIILSLINFFAAYSFMRSRQALTAAASVYAAGRVSACAGEKPSFAVTPYHSIKEGDRFYYDINATGEAEGHVRYSDNTSMFDINPSTGIIDFVPGEYDVGLRSVGISSVESVCNYATDYNDMTFNITNVNDPPSLVSLVVINDTDPTRNITYSFPATEPVEFWEKTQYNISVIAFDSDIIHGDVLTYFVVWYDTSHIQIGDKFTLNESTGRVMFKPVQADVGTYYAQFWVFDGNLEVDTREVEVQILNVNDPPVLHNKTFLKAQTGFSGEPFYLDLNATDIDSPILLFSARFLGCTKANMSIGNCTLFYANPDTGIVQFTPMVFDVGNYSVNYTVTDGIATDWESGNFTMVEYANHPPNITSWDPLPYEIVMFEGGTINFSITVYDPDSGWNTASIIWFKDSVEMIGENGYGYFFDPSFEESGTYNFTAMASDGQYAAYHEWRIIVLDAFPQSTPRARGSQPMPGGKVCIENWRCTMWSACSKEGLQIRLCLDISNCTTTTERPRQTLACNFTPSPTCFDSIRNCHDGACEVLTDCGGPCQPCPTCSDSIRNCHLNGDCEEGVDCGGPCTPCKTMPLAAICGNSICEAGELSTCLADCEEFWVDIIIFWLIIILLIALLILLYVYRKESVLLFIYRKVKGP